MMGLMGSKATTATLPPPWAAGASGELAGELGDEGGLAGARGAGDADDAGGAAARGAVADGLVVVEQGDARGRAGRWRQPEMEA